MTANLCVVCDRPTPDGYACTGCGITRPAGQLAEIAELCGPARDVAHGQTSRGSAGGSGKPGSRLPFDLGATARLDAVEAKLGEHVDHVVATRGARYHNPGTDPIISRAGFLAHHLEWWRHREDVDLFLSDVERCARVVRGLARGPHEQKYLGPCGAEITPTATHTCGRREGHDWGCHTHTFGVTCRCGVTAEPPDPPSSICEGDVYGPRGGSVGRCRVCGAEVATADREAWLDAQTRSEAFSARDIADAYRIPVKTIRNWANRGQLRTYWRTDAGLAAEWPPPDDDQQHERLHYAGDVLGLATAAAVERAEREAARARRKDTAA